MKGILIIADGLGGRPTDVEGHTCLEAARTPHINEAAARGAVGLLDPIGPGVRPGSDVAHLSLFGYDPYNEYPGRGVFEAVGVGLDVQPGDVCFRTNFATIDEDFVVEDRRAGRIESGQPELERALGELDLGDDADVLFKTSTEHRGALLLRGSGLSASISEADPHEPGQPVWDVRPTDHTDEAARTAELVNTLLRQAHDILDDLPINRQRRQAGQPAANAILPRGASAAPHFETLPERYGIQGSVIGGGALYIGIGKLLGLEHYPVEGATGGLDTDVMGKAEAAIEELQARDFVFLHIKGTDSAGHDHNAEAKVDFIEKIDDAVGRIVDHLDWNETHLAFTGDHCTPTVYGDHTAEPVPVLFAGRNVIPDTAERFGERVAQRGGLGRFSGRVIPIIAGYANWLKKYGA
ncbi:MAG: 2,3-bisphosphoglycerate-independent phosphoglycerate mutase [Candidatus Bipolaricaulia bacterium]